MGNPAHLDQVRQRDACHRRVARQRNHCVAVATEHESRYIFDGHIEFACEEIAETRAIEYASHANDLVFGEARNALKRPDHCIERVRDADDEGVGRIFFDARAHLLHHLQVDFEKIVATHAGLARHACRHDDDVSAFDVGVIIHTLKSGVEAFDGRSLGNIQRFALRHAFHNVEQHHIAQLFKADQVR